MTRIHFTNHTGIMLYAFSVMFNLRFRITQTCRPGTLIGSFACCGQAALKGMKTDEAIQTFLSNCCKKHHFEWNSTLHILHASLFRSFPTLNSFIHSFTKSVEATDGCLIFSIGFVSRFVVKSLQVFKTLWCHRSANSCYKDSTLMSVIRYVIGTYCSCAK